MEETKYHLILSKDLGYIDNDIFNKLADDSNRIGRMLNGLINSLQEKVKNDD